MENDSNVSIQKKERLIPSREKNKEMHRRRKVDEKLCATSLLCDPGWYVNALEVYSKWEENTLTKQS